MNKLLESFKNFTDKAKESNATTFCFVLDNENNTFHYSILSIENDYTKAIQSHSELLLKALFNLDEQNRIYITSTFLSTILQSCGLDKNFYNILIDLLDDVEILDPQGS